MRNRGMTLIEVMVGVLLSSLVLGAGYQVLTGSRRDIAKAGTRQILQHEIRIALDTMGADFKSAKRDTFDAADSAGTTVIKFHRFEEELDKEKLDSLQTYEVVYEWNQASRVLRRTSKGQTRYLSSNLVGMSIIQGTGGAAPADSPEALADKARLDIELIGERRTPVTGKIETHTERVSIVIRDQFYAGANKNKYLSLATMMGQEHTDIQADTAHAMLNLSGAITPEQLAGLADAEVREIKSKEEQCLADVMEQYNQIQNQIGEVNTRNDARWYTLWLHHGASEFTAEQNALKNANATAAVDACITSLNEKVTVKTSDYISKASGLSESSLKNPDGEIKDEFKTAFDLKLKAWAAKKAYEEADEETRGDPPPDPLQEFNPSRMEKGAYTDSQGNRQEFHESDEDFNRRKGKAEKIFEASEKINVDTLKEKVGEEGIRTYSSGQSLLDLAHAKRSIIENKVQHESNIQVINTELNSRNSRR
jgi:prepilin-type N-terminal cleavage/methylation domain-containing protein